MKILLLEENPSTGKYLAEALTEVGYSIDNMTENRIFQCATAYQHYDLILLDLESPPKNGTMWPWNTIKSKHHPPVLAIIKSTDQNKSLRFVDDCLVKPYAFSELLTSIRRLILISQGVIRLAGLEINFLDGVVTKSGQRIRVNIYEYAQLEHLAFQMIK